MGQDFKYKAFISYSRQDAELVDDLHARLSKYRTPAALRKQEGRYGAPPGRLNIFLDRKSFEGGGKLSGRLREKLEQSEWLILICSKNSKDRPWVNQEIELFSRRRGAEHILPVFVREDASVPIEDVMPPALAALGENAPVGADIILDGGVIPVRDKLLGAMLGFAQNEIAREQERDDARARRQARRVIASISTLFLLSLALGFGAIVQRDAAQETQAQILSDKSLEATLESWPDRGMLLALEALPAGKGHAPWPVGRKANKSALSRLSTALYRHGERQVLEGHKDWVARAAFSPDGTRIVTASGDGTARVWDAETGAEVATLAGHRSGVSSAAFSPDGTRIVASWDSTARVWDAETGTEIATFAGHGSVVESAAFSPDGARIVTASWDNTARVWEAETGAEIATLEGHEEEVTSAAFSLDGARIVTASGDNTARVWDARTGAEIATLEGHRSGVSSAAFSPDGARIVTASYDNTARVWEAPRPISDKDLLADACAMLAGYKRVLSQNEAVGYGVAYRGDSPCDRYGLLHYKWYVQSYCDAVGYGCHAGQARLRAWINNLLRPTGASDPA